MKAETLKLSELAVSDILEQAEWYELQADRELSSRWELAISSALLGVALHPGSGRLCDFKAAELNDVRRVPVPGFPKHLVFYKDLKSEIVILRVLHGARDIESLFSL